MSANVVRDPVSVIAYELGKADAYARLSDAIKKAEVGSFPRPKSAITAFFDGLDAMEQLGASFPNYAKATLSAGSLEALRQIAAAPQIAQIRKLMALGEDSVTLKLTLAPLEKIIGGAFDAALSSMVSETLKDIAESMSKGNFAAEAAALLKDIGLEGKLAPAQQRRLAAYMAESSKEAQDAMQTIGTYDGLDAATYLGAAAFNAKEGLAALQRLQQHFAR